MFGFGKKVKVTTSVAGVNSIISEHTSVQGPVVFKGAIKISGTVQGKMEGLGNAEDTAAIIESTGDVFGSITCAKVIVSGTVHGDIVADSVFVTKTGKVNGSVTYKGLQMEPGAQVNGNLDCVLNKEPAKVQERDAAVAMSTVGLPAA